MPTRPRESTATVGVNADCAPSGVSFARTGNDDVRPASSGCVTSTSSRFPPEKRESSHVAYTRPLAWSTAKLGTLSPLRTPGTMIGLWSSTIVGAENVRPPSVERTTYVCNAFFSLPLLSKSVPPTSSVPSGSTTGTLPIVCLFCPVARITCGGENVAPPSVERENIAGPVKPPVNGWPVEASISRSQVTYTLPRNGLAAALSTAIACLSLKNWNSVSTITGTGAPQVRPPSVDVLTKMALRNVVSSKPRLTP